MIKETKFVILYRLEADLTTPDLYNRDQRQNDEEHGEQLAEAPVLLALILYLHRGVAKSLREKNDSDGSTDSNSCHEDETQDLDGVEEPLPLAVEVPSRETEDGAVAHDDGNGADVGKTGVGGCTFAPYVPDAGDRECLVVQTLGDSLKNEDAADARQRQVDKHEELAKPSNYPVPSIVVYKSKESSVVRGHGQERQHPDDEEVVRHHGVHLGQTNTLDANALKNLRVTVAIEEFSPDITCLAPEFGEDDCGGEDDGQAGRDHER